MIDDRAHAPGSRGDAEGPAGDLVTLDGERYLRIAGYDRMPPFFMTLPSESDIWLFITSNGGITAGRRDPDRSLFPYETVDKLYDAHHHTGPFTWVRILGGDRGDVLWRPFSRPPHARIERNLYKNTTGNRLVFEEIDHDLGLAFRYRWTSSDDVGLVRTSWLTNTGASRARVHLLDGLRNVLPFGAPLALTQGSSCLVDAYKRTDYDPATRLALYSLTARIVDRPEAAEQLRANAIWLRGLDSARVSVAIDALDTFRRGREPESPLELRGRRGNYIVSSPLTLERGDCATWHIVADVGLSHVDLAALQQRLCSGGASAIDIQRSLDHAGRRLLARVASADGMQLTAGEEISVHHFTNVLFNVMRGGVFDRGYELPAADFRRFLHLRNRGVAERHLPALDALPETCNVREIATLAERAGDADLTRLSLEYLPLTFGRRHGDPSRPWNRFSIRVTNDDSTHALHYEGNWRDIFQNWEALCFSFPGFLPSVVATFVNASTIDGFNPYRISRDGIDWEVVDPDDPWSHIGYWGDHQIAYLLRLLEALERTDPARLRTLLEERIFSYAAVPYRLAPYEDVVRDPHATITFDAEAAQRIARQVERMGTDARLLLDESGDIYHATLLEKLLVPALSKLSNFIPDGGIWMNTQRPEWNDANNALVGNGVSVVTLCYLRRYLRFLVGLLDESRHRSTSLSAEVASWLRSVGAALESEAELLRRDVTDVDRRRLMDRLGESFSSYRAQVYAHGFSSRTEVAIADVVSLAERALAFLERAIAANRRADGLYHSYKLLRLENDSAALEDLYEMLEGQVAALACGAVSASETIEVVECLFSSPLYRRDQKSFLLYPERRLPAFIDRNVVPESHAERIGLVADLLRAGEGSIVARDAGGVVRFHGDLANAADLRATLERLERHPAWAERVRRDRDRVLECFEEVFRHHAYTGRSGTMYAYEGLGCIYWHMTAKLLLAIQEIAIDAIDAGESDAITQKLASAYRRVRSGFGFTKTPAEYGAFPTDPYSHTPPDGGAQQPGMTGQVKEEILVRFGELGVRVEAGIVRFRPALLAEEEFLRAPGVFRVVDVNGDARSIEVAEGMLAFTFCQVPVLYEIGATGRRVIAHLRDGTSVEIPSDRLDERLSTSLLERRGDLSLIHVSVARDALVLQHR